MNKAENISIKNTIDKTIQKNESSSLKKEKIIFNMSVNITIELGRVKLKIQDFLNLSQGSLLILNKFIKEPLDIFMNGTLIASGEIVILEKKYGIRILNVKKSLKSI